MLFVITFCIIITNCLGLEIECPAPIDFSLDQSGKCSPMLQCVIDRDCPDSLICCRNNCSGMFCRKSIAQLNYKTHARDEINITEGGPVCRLKLSASLITCEAKQPEQKQTTTTVAPPVDADVTTKAVSVKKNPKVKQTRKVNESPTVKTSRARKTNAGHEDQYFGPFRRGYLPYDKIF